MFFESDDKFHENVLRKKEESRFFFSVFFPHPVLKLTPVDCYSLVLRRKENQIEVIGKMKKKKEQFKSSKSAKNKVVEDSN